MSKIEKVLLIGGRFDGAWREVESDRMYIELPWSPPVPITPYGSIEHLSTQCIIERVQYKRTDWRFGGEKSEDTQFRHIFVHQLTSAEMFDRLLQGYLPQKMKALEDELATIKKQTERLIRLCQRRNE
jgi:hypothetical protein